MNFGTLGAGFGGLGRGGAGAGYTFTNAEAATLVAAMTAQPTDARKLLIDTLVGALKTAGVWSKMDLLYVLAAHDSQAARLNWKVPASYTLTVSNAPVFTTDRGYVGGATKSLQTGYNLSSGGGAYAQDSAHVGAWSLTDLKESGSLIGTSNAYALPWAADDKFYFQLNSTDGNGASATSLGHYVASRNAAANFDGYRNGSLLSNYVKASAAPDNLDVWLLCRNATGVSQPTARQVSIGHIGSGLSSGEVSAMYTAFLAYLQAVGAV